MTIQTYAALSSAVSEWLARAGDTDLAARFDDFLALHEQRMYYGAKEVPGLLPAFEALRIREMEAANTSFTLAATVAQPTGFLEIIEAYLNNDLGPLDITHEGAIAAYAGATPGRPRILAISGTNFRVYPDPGSNYTATLRYYQKLTTPSAQSANAILTTFPSLYLNGCLLQAAVYVGDRDAAQMFGAMYLSEAGGLNERRNRELAGATNVRLRVRGRTP